MHACNFFINNSIKIAYMQHVELINLGKRIKSLRKRKKMTLSMLCYRNGLEPSTVSRIEAGIVEAKYLTLIKIAKAFNMEICELLDFTDTKTF